MTEVNVRARYLAREQLIVETDGGTLIADHPVRLGGDGRGPSAGELALMALDASTVLTVGAELERLCIDAPVVARSAYRHGQVATTGALASIQYMAVVAQDVEVYADLAPAVAQTLREAAEHAPIVQTLVAGLELREEVVVERTAGPRRFDRYVNEIGRAITAEADRNAASGGATLTDAEQRWRIGATYLGAGSALLKHDHQPYVSSASGGGRGPSPEELLLAALASCTAFYIIHNTGFDAIPFDSVEVVATATVDAGQITAIDRRAHVSGPISDDEAAKIEFFANHCYIGETLRRHPSFERSLATISDRGGSAAVDLLYGPSRNRPSAGIGCDDGSCCIPAQPRQVG